MADVRLTGKILEIGIDDLFFSTTGQQGVIRQANGTFVRLSGYPREHLIGAPHSIVRHPAMPAGVYWTMWDALEAGRPFAGYVHNLSADGSAYTVFATVTPIPQGFLSVRVTPSRSDRLAQVNDLYELLDDLERSERRAGLTRRRAARASAARLTELLGEEGLDSYEEFQWRLLADEIAQRTRNAPGIAARPGATGVLGRMLEAIGVVDSELRSWGARQDTLAELAEALRRTSRRLRDQLERTVTVEQLLDSRPADSVPLREGLDLWRQMQEIVRGYVADLADMLDRLARHGAESRFRIALAQLHTAMLANFAAELIDGDSLSLQSASAITTLAESLQREVAAMAEHYATHQALAAESGSVIERSSAIIAIPRQLLSHWRGATSAAASPAGDQLTSQITKSINEIDAALESLSAIVSQVRSLAAPLDPARVLEHLVGIVAAALRVGQ